MTPTLPRRFRFGLRTLFVLVTVAAVVAAWVTYALKWRQQRQAAIASRQMRAVYFYVICADGTNPNYPRAPGGLWLFGEKGIGYLAAHGFEIERAKRLFPEAEVMECSEPEFWEEDTMLNP